MENSSINVNFEPVENEKDQEAVIEAVLFYHRRGRGAAPAGSGHWTG